jgi:hypothetical protein
MKFKFLSGMSRKKQLGALIVCGALAAAVGTLSASAADSFSTLQVKTENGVRLYSTDDGETWSKQAPEGVTATTDADGKVIITRGTPPMEGGGQASFTKVEDGVTSSSTDGGKTWTKQGK